MDRDQRVALLKLIKKARDDAQLRELFMEFTELASSLPPQQRPAEEGVRDVLLAFGPGRSGCSALRSRTRGTWRPRREPRVDIEPS